MVHLIYGPLTHNLSFERGSEYRFDWRSCKFNLCAKLQAWSVRLSPNCCIAPSQM